MKFPHLYSQQTILVAGFGESGLAMADWILACGGEVRVADSRVLSALPAVQQQWIKEHPSVSAHWSVSWQDATQTLGDFDAVAISPGLNPNDAWFAAQQQNGKAVKGEFSLFQTALDYFANDADTPYQPTVVAITGTNGKTTVTSLVGHIAKTAGVNVMVAGNISPSILHALKSCVEASTEASAEDNSLPTLWVCECSSYQIETAPDFRPHVASLLNISQDHLDRHGSLENYADIKVRLLQHSQIALVNRDDAMVVKVVNDAVSRLFGNLQSKSQAKQKLNAKKEAEELAKYRWFGLNEPQQLADLGVSTEHGLSWLSQMMAEDELDNYGLSDTTLQRRKVAGQVDCFTKKWMPTDALQIMGQHNVSNALAAAGLAQAAGIPLRWIVQGLRTYMGEPHRVQHVASIDGVDFVDDSKGTNTGASIAAIEGLATRYVGQSMGLIAGGDGKGQDFADWANVVQKRIKRVALIGRDAELLQKDLQQAGMAADAIYMASSMQNATAWLAESICGQTQGQNSRQGLVLLSPACASTDQYKNYEHRAADFRAAVVEIAAESGVML